MILLKSKNLSLDFSLSWIDWNEISFFSLCFKSKEYSWFENLEFSSEIVLPLILFSMEKNSSKIWETLFCVSLILSCDIFKKLLKILFL